MRKRREDRVLRTLAVLEPLAEQQREAVRSSLEILVDACTAVQARVKNGSQPAETANGHASNPIAAARKRTT